MRGPMPIEVDPDWWKTLFDGVYLITDARSVCDEALTRREVDLICKMLPLQPGHRILDLCGGHGRHSLELCRRGFRGCTLLDYSRALTDMAREKARANGHPLEVVCCDARKTELSAESFDHVLILGNSIGYIQEPDADRRILSEAYRVLRPGGWLLVDVTDGEAVRRSFRPNAWHEIGDDVVVCREREIRDNVACAREMVLSKKKGLIRDRTYAVRLYDPLGLAALLKAAGFARVTVQNDFSPHHGAGDYGFMNRRMIATGQKFEAP